MSKKPTTQPLHDELNFARFGVISMLTRVDQSVTSWNTEFTVNGRTFRLEAISFFGQPMGVLATDGSAGSATVVLPREHGLALRGHLTDRAPAPADVTAADADGPLPLVPDVDAAGGLAAADLVAVVEELLRAWDAEPPRVLRSGGLSVKDHKAVATLLDADDVIIDGGNTFYKDDIRRAKMLAEKGIHFVDVGTSGGVWGLKEGYAMMIGGDEQAVEVRGGQRAGGVEHAQAVVGVEHGDGVGRGGLPVRHRDGGLGGAVEVLDPPERRPAVLERLRHRFTTGVDDAQRGQSGAGG